MKEKIAIYLAGSIKKAHEENASFWSDEDMALIRKHLANYEISFLNPAFRSDDLSDQKSVFGRDMLQVFCSDIVFVDARERLRRGRRDDVGQATRDPCCDFSPERYALS